MSVIKIENLSFSYFIDAREIPVLSDVSLEIRKGEFVAIQGPSGSGKSTLFYILGCLLKPQQGRVWISGQDIGDLNNSQMARLRNQKIGFVFQHFHLLPRASVLNNILLPIQYRESSEEEHSRAVEKAKSLAERLGLSQLLDNSPNQLSGGQQQRVAIARALMNDVDLVLADEPTGNLDSRNAKEIMLLFKELNEQGKTIVLITHDATTAECCQRVIQMRDGRVVQSENSRPGDAAWSGDIGGEKQHGQSSGVETEGKVPVRLALRKLIKTAVSRSLTSLKRNKTRSILTMLGVTIGIASVLAMITFGQFTKAKILESYETLGVNKVQLWGNINWKLSATDKVPNTFQFFNWEKDVMPLTRLFPQIQFMSPSYNSWSSGMSYGGRTLSENIRVIGVTPEYLAITNREIERGRTLNDYHVESASPVCVIGSEIAQKLFGNQDPVGEILFGTKQDNSLYPCRVIGVLKSQQTTSDWAKPNLSVLMPYTYFKHTHEYWDSQLHQVLFKGKPGTDMEAFAKGIKSFFKIKYGKSGEFGIDSDTILIAQMKRFLTLFTLMLSSVALLTLGVGGIGINNMMLVSVNERFKEIGLLKAIGATDQSIRLQFILESVTLCTTAGVIGILIGFGSYELIIFAASKFVTKLTFEWIFDPVAFLLSFVAIVVVGIASGLTPALKAEKLEVIEALRSE